MSLFCAAYMPDQSLKECQFVTDLTKVAANLTRQRRLTAAQPDVDICFLLPFAQERPGFAGMRFHSWQAAHSTLRFDSAVPANMLHSPLSKRWIIAAMQDAVDNAAGFFTDIQVAFNAQAFHQQIDALATEDAFQGDGL
ncbi:MAG: hypothetical protein KYX62_13390 [Pseudomonadota bacterium]|nr:hypothetical protein [Pseudomonadota bacterium]